MIAITRAAMMAITIPIGFAVRAAFRSHCAPVQTVVAADARSCPVRVASAPRFIACKLVTRPPMSAPAASAPPPKVATPATDVARTPFPPACVWIHCSMPRLNVSILAVPVSPSALVIWSTDPATRSEASPISATFGRICRSVSSHCVPKSATPA